MLTISKHLLDVMSGQLHSKGEKTMHTECSCLLASGEKCHAPAVAGSSLCRHHRPRKHAEQHTPLKLPHLNDRSSILFAISEVLHAVSEHRITRKDAGTLLFGLQMASTVVTEIYDEIYNAPDSGEHADCAEPVLSESASHPACESDAAREALIQQAQALMAAIQNRSIASGLAAQNSPAERRVNPPKPPLTPTLSRSPCIK
jgi:hypothetical protein